MSNFPAILGGLPVRPEGPPDWPFPDDDVASAIANAIRDGSWGKYDGGHVEQFETALAQYHAVTHALTGASGTLAVELALRALQVGDGDEVVMAAYDYEPNFLAVHLVGARPVLVDVAPRNWNFDTQNLNAAISNTTKAIIVSHLHGGIVDMAAVMTFARRHNLSVIEDAAQATGAMIQGRRAGTWGDVGVLSFGGSKLLTAGRGGALLTSHADVHQRLRLLLRRGVQQWAALSELQAAVLIPQLAKLDERNQQRSLAVDRLCELLHDVPGFSLFQNDVESSPAYYKVGFQFDEKRFGISRDRFVAAVRAEGIAIDAGFRALHVGRAPGRFGKVGELTNAALAHDGVELLHHPVLLCNDEAIQQVARAVHKAYSNVGRLAT